MNRLLVIHNLGAILLIEAAAMVPSLLVALCYGDPGDAMSFVKTIAILLVLGLPAWKMVKPAEKNLRAKEGFLTVALSWLLLSVFGALPFVFSGMIPNMADAFFEAVSGFTTTGATVLTVFEGQPRGIMFWRSFTHWIGGMGVLVLSLALLPKISGRTSHLVRAESPGPTLSKIVPKMGDTAKILYIVYAALTVLQFILLWIAGLSPYDAAIHAFGTAGTGGFSNYGGSVGELNNVAAEVIITIFMIVFGTNLALYYRMLKGEWKDALKSEELRWFLAIVGSAILLISMIILPEYGNFWKALRYGSFQVASIISTTGYGTADFNLWAPAAKMLLVLLMFIGSCAGSTAGGLKVVRVAMLTKMGRREMRRTFQPRKVEVVRFEGRGVDESVLNQVGVYFFVYVAIILIGALLISFEGAHDLESNLTAAITCVSNVGPGMAEVGPMGNYAGYNAFSKLVLSVLMLAGRLELFPILVLMSRSIWGKN